MPIPARPIPTPAPRRAPTSASGGTPSVAARPGSSVPRRGLYFMDHADIHDLPLPNSAPVKGLSGVTLVKQKNEVKVDESKGRGRVEVSVSELVMDGLGKREKRTTTATSLGFDFIPNPSVLALPDHPTASGVKPTSPSPLGQTPRTPALVPTQTNEQEEEDDDWEHIEPVERDQSQDHADEGDIILLSEMELDDAGMEPKERLGERGKMGLRSGDKSYAAVVGAATLTPA